MITKSIFVLKKLVSGKQITGSQNVSERVTLENETR
jgi:hypothetical protein